MESETRFLRAISGPKPDRVPTAPLLYYFAGRHAGFTTAQLVGDPVNYRIAIERCWEDFGPWDVYYPLNAINRDFMSLAMPMANAYPGAELPENASVQYFEEEIMKPEDYGLLAGRPAPFDLKGLPPPSPRVVAGAFRSAPDPFRSAYGAPRDPAVELRGWAAFVKTIARLVADPQLKTEPVLRYARFMLKISGRVLGVSDPAEVALRAVRSMFEQFDFSRYDFAAWRARGVAPLFGIGLEGPFDSFSMARSMLPFSRDDLFERPDTLRKACDASVDFFVAMGELGTALTGIPRFIYAAHRTSNDFISPAIFRDIAFPAMREITERLAARGITMIFHCDGKWDLNLEYLARLPEGKCVFQFDGRTDMFLARRKLGDGHCIFGDVPAAMLAFGNEKEVEAYCRKLIREVGANGRFILGAGCEIPPDAKPENVRALLRAPCR